MEGADEATLHRAADDAFRAIERVHRLMSFHSENSDVTRLNRQAHREPVDVDAETWEVLEIAGRVSRATQGVFDVTVGGSMMEHNALPRMTDASPDPQACFRDLELTSARRQRKARPEDHALGPHETTDRYCPR